MRLGLTANWANTYLELKYNLSDTDMYAGGIDKVKITNMFKFKHYLGGDKNKIINFSFQRREYDKEDDTRTYIEDIYEGKYTYRF